MRILTPQRWRLPPGGVGKFYLANTNGCACDGVTDDTAAFNALLQRSTRQAAAQCGGRQSAVPGSDHPAE